MAFLHCSSSQCENWTVTSHMSCREVGTSSVIMLKYLIGFALHCAYWSYYGEVMCNFPVSFAPQMT